MKRPGLRGFVRTSFVFVVLRPVVVPFLRPLTMFRQARAILQDMPIERADTARPDALIKVGDEETIYQRRISRRWAFLFMALSIGVWGWWLVHTLFAAWAFMSLPSLETIMLSVALGLQSLVQCYTNWRSRGHQGSFTAFLSDARHLWPR